MSLRKGTVIAHVTFFLQYIAKEVTLKTEILPRNTW